MYKELQSKSFSSPTIKTYPIAFTTFLTFGFCSIEFVIISPLGLNYSSPNYYLELFRPLQYSYPLISLLYGFILYRFIMPIPKISYFHLLFFIICPFILYFAISSQNSAYNTWNATTHTEFSPYPHSFLGLTRFRTSPNPRTWPRWTPLLIEVVAYYRLGFQFSTPSRIQIFWLPFEVPSLPLPSSFQFYFPSPGFLFIPA